MAKPLKKATPQTAPTPEVEIDKTVVGETDTTAEQTAEDTEGVSELNEELGDTEQEQTEETTPEEPKQEKPAEKKEPEVKVDTTIDKKKKPMENVKIRMAADHSCVIAMERYDLKAGKTYNVPRNVRNILNKRGLLKPL